ncbi:flippase [Pseudooceanicola sp.]|uniref:flippase n=1 Tax=Pseudooceanicola sp. TaxID=1914328 RepID=UPI0026070CFA|nr:flippase [Pseudooceanicola sp.]MDF1854284.1 flippase [Pseudooceanicola sp.]
MERDGLSALTSDPLTQSANSAPKTGHSKLTINPTKSLAWPFAEKILRLFLGTALTLLIAREIGPTEFGTFSTVFAGYMLFGALAGLGLKDVVIDEIASARTAPHMVLSTASAMVFTASLVLSFAFVVLIKLIYPGYGTEFWVAFILSAILLLKGLEVLLWGLEAHVELQSIALSQQISIIASAIGKIAILLIGATVISFAAVTALEYLVLFAAAVVFASKHGLVLSKGAFRIEYAVALLKRSWPLAASSLAVVGYFYVDQIVIAVLMDVESVGIYAAASRISQQLYILPTVLVAAYYPRLTHIHAQSPETFDEGFKDLSVVLVTLSIILWGVILLLSDPLLELILGSHFDETATILKLHALGLIFVSLNIISGRWYVMQGLQNLTLVRQLLTACLNVLLNFILIPFFGLDGAVYATLVSLLFLAFGFDLLSVRTRKLSALKSDIICRLFSFHAVKSSFASLQTL